MDDREIPFNPASMAAGTEGFDMILAMLLLTGRVRAENLSMLNSDLAKLDLSGGTGGNGLETLAQMLSHIPPPEVNVKSFGKGKSAVTGSFWKALKDFALPPINKN